jgi:citrate synthase
LVRVVSSYTSDLSAFAAGELCQAGAPIGHYATARAAELLVELSYELGDRLAEPGAVTEHIRTRLARGERLHGIGSAFLRSSDERIALLRARAEARGRAQLPFFRLFLELETALEQLGEPAPNAVPAFAALCLDLGLTPSQCGTLAAMLCAADFLGNAVEGAEQAPAVLRELPADAIAYRGPAARSTPRANATKSVG